MKNRKLEDHHKRAEAGTHHRPGRKAGGAVTESKVEAREGDKDDDAPVREAYTAKGSKVLKDVAERKRGGKVEGKMSKMRLDRPGRKRGGRVGADKSPLSEAARMSDRPGHVGPDDGCA